MLGLALIRMAKAAEHGIKARSIEYKLAELDRDTGSIETVGQAIWQAPTASVEAGCSNVEPGSRR
jgi:hypothetical protein